jgi:hypothetical protein
MNRQVTVAARVVVATAACHVRATPVVKKLTTIIWQNGCFTMHPGRPAASVAITPATYVGRRCTCISQANAVKVGRELKNARRPVLPPVPPRPVHAGNRCEPQRHRDTEKKRREEKTRERKLRKVVGDASIRSVRGAGEAPPNASYEASLNQSLPLSCLLFSSSLSLCASVVQISFFRGQWPRGDSSSIITSRACLRRTVAESRP